MPVALVQYDLLTSLESFLPANVGRSLLVSEMIKAYGLDEQCEHITVKPATQQRLTQFHDDGFVEQLFKWRSIDRSKLTDDQLGHLTHATQTLNINDTDVEDEAEYKDEKEEHTTLEKYGLLYDCPVFPLMRYYVQYLAGSTISAAQHLIRNPSTTVINWHGGRHHAKKSSASGFCYVNDIVLGILELRKRYEKVVYLDLDLHHGDGVEGAFKFTDKVVTISVHFKDIGFFPGSGALKDQGIGKGKGKTFNAPMRHGLSDVNIEKVVERCVVPVIEKFGTDCIVVQCGADGLGSDEHQQWNLSIRGFGEVIKRIIDLKKPTMLIGGGGYNHSQVARCWTYLTSVALGQEERFHDVANLDINCSSNTHDEDALHKHLQILPDSFLDKFPNENYEFWDEKGRNMVDENTDDYINEISRQFEDQMSSWV